MPKSFDPNVLMFQIMQKQMVEMQSQNQAMAAQMQTFAEKVGGTPNGNLVGAGRGGNQS